MSQYPRDDYNITPDWDDLELDWLDDFDIETSMDESRREPRQTHFAPDQTPRKVPSRQIPAAPSQRPAPSRRPAAPGWEERVPLWDEDIESAWEEPVPTRREPSPAPRRSAPSGQGQPAPRRSAPSGQSQPAPRRSAPSGQGQPTARRSAPSGQGQPAPARQGEPSRRNARTSRREVAPPGASPWEQEQEDPRYRGRTGKRRRKSNAPLIILIIVLVAGMGFAGWKLGSIFLNYRRDRSSYSDLASHAISGLAEFDTEEDAGDGDGVTRNHSVSEIPISVDWDYLRSINANVVGWIYCPGTVISYPVVQTSDHDYYLTHGFDGSSNVSGTLFADRNSVSGITQSNYIIYGHNMKDNSMFGTFANYVDKSYYDENPILYYLTPDANYRVELLCAHITESTLDNYPTYFSSASDYQDYLNKITANAFWVNYDVLSTDYQLMSMSTCAYTAGYEDPRMLVHGMMIPLDEPAQEQTEMND